MLLLARIQLKLFVHTVDCDSELQHQRHYITHRDHNARANYSIFAIMTQFNHSDSQLSKWNLSCIHISYLIQCISSKTVLPCLNKTSLHCLPWPDAIPLSLNSRPTRESHCTRIFHSHVFLLINHWMWMHTIDMIETHTGKVSKTRILF